MPSRLFSVRPRRNSGADLGCIALLWLELLGTWAFRTASLLVGAPIRDANGEIQKWLGTCTDIETYLLEFRLRRAHEVDQQFSIGNREPSLRMYSFA